VNLVGSCRSVEVVIVEHLSAEDHCLVNEDVELGLSLEVPGVTYCNKVPVVASFVEEIMDVLDRVI
jgi:hypothetical protein